ncbi:hypothetical protein JRQ81_013048 [Phrynocephalus forsythii]|uniref:Uncharacterized protein n=1 Tax=Phrynocephalus forsythii TaxID=171643 RepID=A0A9Q0XZ30_9SAUR|nr:hypothetical protein JRQ81_013048 [Phrynocephalus forsythii]
MSQGVTYADLRFVRSPPEAKKRSPPAGLGRWTWPLALALLGACLFLLAGAIGLGIRYWQVSRQLQQASEGHSAEWEALAESISSKEGQLDEARAELGFTRLTLQGCWTAGNSTQERLQGLERELRLAKDQLAVLQEEKNRMEELNRARSCQQRGKSIAPQKQLFPCSQIPGLGG